MVNEEERAKKLSDAIDAVLRGDQPELDLDDSELIELLRIARLRHRVGQRRAAVAGASQELVWRVLKARMAARQMKRDTEAEHPA
jgi:hypothetical protein